MALPCTLILFSLYSTVTRQPSGAVEVCARGLFMHTFFVTDVVMWCWSFSSLGTSELTSSAWQGRPCDGRMESIQSSLLTVATEWHSGWVSSSWHALQPSESQRSGNTPTSLLFPKPNKPAGEAKSYWPISLLSICFKLFEKRILNRINSIVEEVLPQEQAGFCKGWSTNDQVTLLTDDIETAFEERKKAGVVMVDLSLISCLWHRPAPRPKAKATADPERSRNGKHDHGDGN